jgi:adenylate cyclase class IV
MRRFGNIARVAIAMVERQSGESVYNFPMASAKKTNREVEIKVRVPDVALMRRLLQRAGAVAQRRVFEQNALFDSESRRRSPSSASGAAPLAHC